MLRLHTLLLLVAVNFPQEGGAKHWIYVDSDAPKSEKTSRRKLKCFPFSLTKSKSQDMHLQFAMVQQQQELYFQTEKTILDAIWAATDNAWYNN